jgi:hypothetical protein
MRLQSRKLLYKWYRTKSWHYNTTPTMRDNQTAWLRRQGWDVCRAEREHYTEHLCSRLADVGCMRRLAGDALAPKRRRPIRVAKRVKARHGFLHFAARGFRCGG